MANEKLSDLTPVPPPLVDGDVMYVVQGGESFKIDMLQITAFMEPGLDADSISFSDPSTNGLIATDVGAALRELDDNLDSHKLQPTTPSFSDTMALPDPTTVARMMAYTAASGKTVYSNGVQWRYFAKARIEVLHENLNVDVRSIWYDAANARWSVCGDDGYIATSDDDGVSWTTRTSGVTTALRTIKKWGANWYCVGWGTGSSPATALVSTDGAVTWAAMTITTDDSAGSNSSLVDIAFSTTKMLFIGFEVGSTGALIDEITSVGSVIEHRNNPATPNFLYGVNWDEGASLFYLCGAHWSGGVPTAFVATSPDGVTLTDTTDTGIMTDEIWTVWGENGTVFVTQANNPIKMFRNDNSGAAGSWSRITLPIDLPVGTDPWRTVEGDGDLMFCGGDWWNNGVIMLSIGGTGRWEVIYFENAAEYGWRIIRKAGFGNGIWLAVGREPNNIYKITL